MEKIKLIAVDLDGTLLNSRSEISPATLKILKELASKNIKLVLATGRPTNSLKRFVKLIGNTTADDYSISFNGARILSNKDFSPLDKKDIAYDVVRRAYALSVQEQVSFFAYNQYEELISELDSDYVEFEHHLTASPLRIEPFVHYKNENFIKMTFTESKENIDRISNAVNKAFSDYTVVRSHAFFLEILNPQASKGQALKTLLKKLNISPDEVFAFGDNDNDLEMIKSVKYGFVMNNSFSEELRKHAYEIVPSNDEEGVYQTIKKYLF